MPTIEIQPKTEIILESEPAQTVGKMYDHLGCLLRNYQMDIARHRDGPTPDVDLRMHWAERIASYTNALLEMEKKNGS